MPHRFRLTPCLTPWLAVLLLAPATASAAEIKVLNANALTVAMKELAADFTKQTGNQVSFVGVSPGLVEQRLKAGETYDLVITATESGLTETIKPKLQLSSGNLESAQERIAKGEVELGLFNLSEIPRAPGVVRAGPVPAAVQVYINYDSAIPASNTSPAAAQALLDFFHRPASKPVWDKAGLEVVGE